MAKKKGTVPAIVHLALVVGTSTRKRGQKTAVMPNMIYDAFYVAPSREAAAQMIEDDWGGLQRSGYEVVGVYTMLKVENRAHPMITVPLKLPEGIFEQVPWRYTDEKEARCQTKYTSD